MRPNVHDIAVPPFPPGLEWVGAEPAPIERLCARGPVLVHFLDAGHVSSVRTLPYLRAWHERYGECGLTVLGVNSPRFAFTGEPGALAAALARLEVAFPVAVDRDYGVWHGYGCEGWPSLFLWGRGGVLRWFHFGEGDYEGTEQAIAAELGDGDPPEPLAPLRPCDAPGALVMPPSDEVFPGGSPSEPWAAGEGEDPLRLEYEAGEAHVTLDGRGTLEFSLDGSRQPALEVTAPGLHELAVHPRHERHALELMPGPGLRVWSVGFGAGVP